MLFELLGPSGAGKTFFLEKFMKPYNFILFPSVSKDFDIDKFLKKIKNTQLKSCSKNIQMEEFSRFCIETINKSLMDYIKKSNALKIFANCCIRYDKNKILDECGHIIINDELILHRAFTFLTYSSDFENDTKKFFELVPLPDVVCLCTCTKELIKERIKKREIIPNSYANINEQTMDILIDKSLQICEIAQKILKERGANLVILDLSLSFEDNQKKFEEVVNNKINEYKEELRLQLLEACRSFQKNNTRYFLKTENVFYCSFSTPNFVISKEESQRDSERRFERFGITKQNLKGKTVLDLGSNCGAMLLQASNYKIMKGRGIEYDIDKVILANKVAKLSRLNHIQFIQGNIDELDENNMEKFDVVFALAIEKHVNDREHLLRILSKVTNETLYFEGNSKCDIENISQKLKEHGFNEIKQLGFCDDDIRPQNNTRPMLIARKIKNEHKKIVIQKRVFLAILLTMGTMFVTYKLWHHTSILIFISFLILSFLLAYKLVDYVADFKTIKNNSRIDIIFLLIFFILLCIPASHISKTKKAKGENRYLAPKANFIDHKKLNLKYGKDFNSYFDDRFNFRYEMIKLKTLADCSLNMNYCANKRVTFYKKENFMYRNGIWGLPEIKNDKTEVLKTYAQNINKLQKYCDDNNIKLYMLIIPRQADFFDYHLADSRKYKPDPAEEVIDYLKNNTKTNMIYPKAAMLEANKETPVYFKTDHHWTKKGAYIGYFELMKEIKKDFPAVSVLQESSLEKYYDKRVAEHWYSTFNNGQIYKHLGLPERYAKKILNSPYLYYKNPNRDKLKTNVHIAPIPEIGKSKKEDNQFYYPYGLDKKVMIIGNSFTGGLVEFLPYSFKYTARYFDNYRYMHFETYKDVFKQYKPDIFIININTNYLYSLLNLYPNKYRKEQI